MTNKTKTNTEEMYCTIIDEETGKVCGEIDDTLTAYCIKHGRTPHRMRKKVNEEIIEEVYGQYKRTEEKDDSFYNNELKEIIERVLELQKQEFKKMLDEWFIENSQIAEEQECKDLGIKRNGIINDMDIETLKSQLNQKGEEK